MSLSECTDPGHARQLDEVRAKIFYLACDIEQANQPAARLLRAVAESIAEATEVTESVNGHGLLNGRSAVTVGPL